MFPRLIVRVEAFFVVFCVTFPRQTGNKRSGRVSMTPVVEFSRRIDLHFQLEVVASFFPTPFVSGWFDSLSLGSVLPLASAFFFFLLFFFFFFFFFSFGSQRRRVTEKKTLAVPTFCFGCTRRTRSGQSQSGKRAILASRFIGVSFTTLFNGHGDERASVDAVGRPKKSMNAQTSRLGMNQIRAGRPSQ